MGNQEAINIPDSRETWRFWESEDMERGGGGGAGKREKEKGRRGEGGGGCEEIRMADGQQDTTQRGPAAWRRTLARLFGSPLLNFSLSDPPVRVRESVQKLYVDEVFDLAHRHYP